MAKKYSYNKINAITKGAVTLSGLAYFVGLVAFIVFLAIYYLPSLNHLIDFTELSFVVGKVFLKIDAFLIIGFVITLLGFVWSIQIPKALAQEKGGFRGFLLTLMSIVLIVFFIIIKSKDLQLSYLLNYTFGGVLVVGILGLVLGLFTLFVRFKTRRQIEKKIRKFERNYIKFDKYNR